MDKSAVSAINSWVVGSSGFGARDAQVFRALEDAYRHQNGNTMMPGVGEERFFLSLRLGICMCCRRMMQCRASARCLAG